MFYGDFRRIRKSVGLIFFSELNPRRKNSEQNSKFKKAFNNKLFESLDRMKNFIDDLVKPLNPEEIISICRCSCLYGITGTNNDGKRYRLKFVAIG